MFAKTTVFLALLAIPTLPALAASSAVPGTLNYVEGQVSVAGQPVTPQSVGSVQLHPNQTLATGQGRAELLLTPGVFVRLGDNSSLRLISPNLGDTRVQLLSGRAIAEVTELFEDDNLWVMLNGTSVRLDKEGLYSFDAASGQVRVFDGKATVEAGDRHVDLKKGRQLALAGNLKATRFDTKSSAAGDPLYAWSNLRSEYEAEASMQSARTIFAGGGAYWDGPGWYWNPYWDMYGFIPGDGIWFSPFGWPYYSPWVAYGGGFYGGGFYGHGWGRGGLALHGHGHLGGGTVASRGGLGGHGFAGHGFASRGFAGRGFGGGGFAGHGFAGGMHGGFGGGRR
jgi:hypothetical protein